MDKLLEHHGVSEYDTEFNGHKQVVPLCILLAAQSIHPFISHFPQY